MDSNIYLIHATENQTMTFGGNVKLERWNRILFPVDDMTRISISRALREGVFDYQYTWRTNSDIIGSFIGCLARAKVEAGDIIRLCHDLFVPTWWKGLEQAIHSINGKLRIPLPEKCIKLPVGSLDLEIAFHCPSLVIRESLVFYHEWPKMEASIHILLGWRRIIADDSRDWLIKYLHLFNAYIKLGVIVDNLDGLNFYTVNAEKTSGTKVDFEFPPNYYVEQPNDIPEVIMVYWKWRGCSKWILGIFLYFDRVGTLVMNAMHHR